MKKHVEELMLCFMNQAYLLLVILSRIMKMLKMLQLSQKL